MSEKERKRGHEGELEVVVEELETEKETNPTNHYASYPSRPFHSRNYVLGHLS